MYVGEISTEVFIYSSLCVCVCVSPLVQRMFKRKISLSKPTNKQEQYRLFIIKAIPIRCEYFPVIHWEIQKLAIPSYAPSPYSGTPHVLRQLVAHGKKLVVVHWRKLQGLFQIGVLCVFSVL